MSSFIFDAEQPLDRDLPLTIDPTGVHMRTDGVYYLAGCPPDDDPAVDYDDFEQDHSIWENKVWPVIANRIPQFEAIKLMNSWAGHYASTVLTRMQYSVRTRASETLFLLTGFQVTGYSNRRQ